MNSYIETTKFLKSKITCLPKIAIILGSGMSEIIEQITIELSISYSEIPNFSHSTIDGHKGNLIFGTINNQQVVIMQGRFHYYEGYSMNQVTFPIRVFALLGVEYLFVTNASGGLNPTYKTGDLMIIRDHINFFPEHPLRGKNKEEFGVRFPDMSETYSKLLIAKAKEIAYTENIKVQEGVYIGSSGPSLETLAEYSMFRFFGADATGMSTVPEVIVAHHAGIKCFGLSVITNESSKAAEGEITTHEDVQKYASSAGPRVAKLLSKLILNISEFNL